MVNSVVGQVRCVATRLMGSRPGRAKSRLGMGVFAIVVTFVP